MKKIFSFYFVIALILTTFIFISNRQEVLGAGDLVPIHTAADTGFQVLRYYKGKIFGGTYGWSNSRIYRITKDEFVQEAVIPGESVSVLATCANENCLIANLERNVKAPTAFKRNDSTGQWTQLNGIGNSYPESEGSMGIGGGTAGGKVWVSSLPYTPRVDAKGYVWSSSDGINWTAGPNFNPSIPMAFADFNNKVWTATIYGGGANGIYYLSGGRWIKHYNLPADLWVNDMVVFKGNLYIGIEHGIYKMNSQNQVTKVSNRAGGWLTIARDTEGIEWLYAGWGASWRCSGSQSELWRSKDGTNWELYQKFPECEYQGAATIKGDASDELFIATRQEGGHGKVYYKKFDRFIIPEVDLKINGADATSTIHYKYNASTTINLSWTTKNADSCSASGGWSGSKISSGSESITRVFATSTTFTLTCKNNKNPDKTGSDSVALEVQRGADDAIIVANTIPSNMEAAKNYNGSITVKNIGNNAWTKSAGYALKALGDAIYFLGNSEFLLNDSENIATGQDKTFNFAMTSLTASGTYAFAWTMKNGSGEQFGEKLSKSVGVSPFPECSPLKVDYGTVSPYPECKITCGSGYVLSGNSCVITSVSYEQKIKDIQAQIQNAQQSLSILIPLILANPNDSGTAEAVKTVTDHIADLTHQLNELKSQTPITVFSFSRNFGFGSQSDDVKKLQEFLANPPIGGAAIYPEGIVSGYFGSLTQKAVQKFQCKYDIICSGTVYFTGYGSVGPKTRAKLNELIAQ